MPKLRPAKPPTPWVRRLKAGIYQSKSGRTEAYFEWPTQPLEYAGRESRMSAGRRFAGMLAEVGEQSVDLTNSGVEMMVLKRRFHIWAGVYDAAPDLPSTPTVAQSDFLNDVVPVLTPAKSVLVGFVLRSERERAMEQGIVGAAKGLKDTAIAASTGARQASMSEYQADYDQLSALMSRYGAGIPSRKALQQLEGFLSNGGDPDVPVTVESESLQAYEGDEWQFSVVSKFESPELPAVDSMWIHAAMDDSSPADVVSIRGSFMPAQTLAGKLRQSQRRWRAAAEEEAKTGDIERQEIQQGADFANRLESIVEDSSDSWLSDMSIVFARRAVAGGRYEEDFSHTLKKHYGIHSHALVGRQLELFEEMQPCGQAKANPFPQTVNNATVAFSGLTSFSSIGDPSGYMYMGHGLPDQTINWLDPLLAPKLNATPGMGIFGQPGSGKTFTAQVLALQAVLSGLNCTFVNPKGFDSLAGLVRYMKSIGLPARLVSLQDGAAMSGAFDPFGYAPTPTMAAEILKRHLLTVMATPINQVLTAEEGLTLSAGLIAGAEAGARCAREALNHVPDERIIEKVNKQLAASTLFRIAFAEQPHPNWGEGQTGFTLVEFDRELPLPKPGQAPGDVEEAIGLAGLRAVTRGSMENLMRSGGGVMAIDEAHHYLSSQEGLDTINRLLREGRSLNLLPIFCTQKVNDLVKAGVSDFLSRVICMQLEDQEGEATAALKMLELEVTESNLRFLAEAKAQPPSEGRPAVPARGFYKDVYKRSSAFLMGPYPEELRQELSTNPDDKAKMAALRELETAA